MKERPIIFIAPMVRAILDGHKTQTRRPVKHIPLLGDPLEWCSAAQAGEPGFAHIVGDYRRFCPYGQPGARLWVKETWASMPLKDGTMGYAYRADGDEAFLGIEDGYEFMGRWRPSIHMARRASRLTLEVVAVRVERVQEITSTAASAEGVDERDCDLYSHAGSADGVDYRSGFVRLWDRINAARGLGWDSNPWVWVVEFRRVQA